MPLNLASPGIIVREVDLTVGAVRPTSNKIGAIVAPFAKGPVDAPTLVESENDLLSNFGSPYPTDKHYENWLVASSYLAYGGSLQVVRADDTDLKNGFVGTSSSVKIKSLDHYNQLGYDETTINGVVVAAKNPGSWSNGIKVAIIDAKADQTLGIGTTYAAIGYGVTQALSGSIAGVGTTSTASGYIKGIITGISTAASTIDVKVLSYVSAGGTETAVDYQPSGVYKFIASGISTTTSTIGFSSTGGSVGVAVSATSATDWFDQQTIGLTSTSSINWNNIAPRPSTSAYAAARNSRFDEVHVVVIDSLGNITGNAGTILEKHLSLSKATDAEFSAGSTSYWRKYIANNSQYIFAGGAPAGIVTTGFSTSFISSSDNGWDQTADGGTNGVLFGAAGSSTNTLSGGKNYNGGTDIMASTALTSDLGKLSAGYDLFENTDNYKVDFLLMGSAGYGKETAQALANKLISVAELRKDALAFISPY